MKKSIKLILMSTMLCILGVLTACSGGKTPYDGYVDLEYVENNIINKLSAKEYSQYTVKSEFNFMGKKVKDFPENYIGAFEFVPAPDEYSELCASHYLFAPLQLTSTNWVVKTETGDIDDKKSTREKLLSRLYKVHDAYNDTYYVYLEEDGGFSIRSYGVNKPIILYVFNKKGKKEKRLETRGKFDITLRYNKDGFLVYESFQTINTNKDSKDKTIYAYTTYEYK